MLLYNIWSRLKNAEIGSRKYVRIVRFLADPFKIRLVVSVSVNDQAMWYHRSVNYSHSESSSHIRWPKTFLEVEEY